MLGNFDFFFTATLYSRLTAQSKFIWFSGNLNGRLAMKISEEWWGGGGVVPFERMDQRPAYPGG